MAVEGLKEIVKVKHCLELKGMGSCGELWSLAYETVSYIKNEYFVHCQSVGLIHLLDQRLK